MRKEQATLGVRVSQVDAEKIRKWLRLQAMTQSALAEKIGISTGVLRNVLTGSATLKKEAHAKLIDLIKSSQRQA